MKKTTYSNFKDLLTNHEYIVLSIKNRLSFLKDIQKEIAEKSCTPKFNIEDDNMFLLVKDSIDMLFIELCSLSEGLYLKNGFLDQIKYNFLKELNDEIKTNTTFFYDKHKSKSENDEELIHVKETQKIFKKIFKTYRNKKNKFRIFVKDIDLLKIEIKKLSEEIVDDRNEYRAHKFEKGKIRTNSPTRLGLKNAENQLFILEDLLNDFRIIFNNSGFAYMNTQYRSPDESAQDVVDIILYGGIEKFNNKIGFIHPFFPYYWQARSKFYLSKKNISKLIQIIKIKFGI